MKKIIFLMVLSFFIGFKCCAQKRTYKAKECINKNSINLKTTQILFKIEGLIEIDGHTFLNDTCVNPIMFKADINGAQIKKLRPCLIKYEYRKCSKEDCNILHLERIDTPTISDFRYAPPYFQDNMLMFTPN